MNAPPLNEEIEAVRRYLEDPDRRTKASRGCLEVSGDIVARLSGVLDDLLKATENLREKNRELERSRSAAQEERERYREFFVSAPEAYVVTDQFGIIREANRMAEELLRPGTDDPAGSSLLQYISPADRDALLSSILRTSEGAGALPWEGIVRSPDRRSLRISGTVAPVFDSDGTLAGLRWIFRDVTEEELRQEKVKESADLLEAIFENLGDIIGIQTPDRRMIRYNRATYDLLGMEPGEVIGKRCYEVIGRTTPCPVCASAQAAESGKPVVIEKYVPELGRHLECRASPILNDEGEAVLIIEQLCDISDRVAVSEALERANAYNRSLIEASPDPMAVIDPHGVITDMNAAVESISGYARDALIKTAFSDYFTDPERAAGACREALETGSVRDYPLLLQNSDGHTVPLLCNASVFRDPDGTVLGVVVAARDTSELQHAKAAIRENERKSRQIIESLNEGIWKIDQDCRTTYVNPQMAGILGYTVDEMLGRHLFSFMDDEGVAIAEDALSRRRQGIRESHEFVFLHKDSSRVRTLVSAAPLVDTEGNYTGAIAAVLDITEWTAAEAALRESEERYRSFVQNFQGVAFRSTLDFRPVFLHGKVQAITGYTEDEILRGVKRWELLIHPDDRERLRESTGLLTATPGHVSNREYRIIRKDGGVRWVQELARNVSDGSGGAVRIEGTIYDITDRKQAEEALRESEKKFRDITQRSFDMIYTCYHRDGITFISPAVERILGFSPEELVGSKCGDYVAPECRPRWEAAHRTIAGGNPVEGVQIRLLRKDGTYAAVEMSESPIFKDDAVVGVQVVGRDITERKKAEIALRESEERFRSIFEESPIGILVYDAQGKLLTLNDACSGIFGIDGSEDLQDFTLFEDPNLPDPELRPLLEGQVVRFRIPYDFDLVRRRNLYTTKRSGVIFIDVLITPIEAGGSDTPGYMVQVQDVTGQVRMEALKQQAYDRINKNIEQFAILGDHVRQPLQVILGTSELIDDDRTEKIVDQVGRINDIVKQLDQGWVESRKVREFLQRNE
ncbi:PAS domain S-box protein [Methanoculleus sp. FWC-SCC1]|uniref:histidine kinase n=1 Tax=Methanoculleus frigidifontis TaxID=2584085 RepID=A0ABT8MA37_9EURY|nr:PAS domain S-box protein [Methanoculleus sp. FWC-SCC1]MDN7024803.1 PAS domain S-box protein [Methanoculleus sp. FWC-SCC1]